MGWLANPTPYSDCTLGKVLDLDGQFETRLHKAGLKLGDGGLLDSQQLSQVLLQEAVQLAV